MASPPTVASTSIAGGNGRVERHHFVAQHRDVFERVGHLQPLGQPVEAGGGDPDDQRGSGWSGLPPCRSRSCTWSSAFPPCRRGSCGVLSLVDSVAVCRLWPLRSRSSQQPPSGSVLVARGASSPRAAPAPPRRPGFHSSTRSIAPCTSTSASSPANVTQMGRDRHPPLAVDLHLVPSSRPRSGPGCGRPGPTSARSCIACHLPLELPGVQRARQPSELLSQVAAPLELGAELRRQDHPALRVERVLVPPDEACHSALSPTTLPGLRPSDARLHRISSHFTPFPSTSQPP